MKIIIAGAGEVGTHLAKLLASENQDIILMDKEEEKLRPIESKFDLMTMKGNPTSLKDLREVGVGDADLFIAVTPEESTNMTACMLATNMGSKKTLARIDNYEYLLPKNKEFFKRLGVDSLIYPEMLAAHEIVNSLKKNWARQWLEFYDGALYLIATKIRDESPVVNKKFQDLFANESNMRVVAIKRQSETIMPKGQDIILLDDVIYVMVTPDQIVKLRKMAGKEDKSIDDIMIMGGSRIAQKTCQYLPDSINVKVIEKDKDRAYSFLENVSKNVVVINGDGRDTDLILEEGVEHMDAFIAVTGNSEANIMACLAARRAGVKKIIAEIENIDYFPLAEKLDIGTIVNKKRLAASHIYQYTLDANVTELKCLANIDVDIVEFEAKANSKMTKGKVRELNLPHDMNLGGLIRDKKGYIVTGETEIKEGDHVICFCDSLKTRKIEKYFN